MKRLTKFGIIALAVFLAGLAGAQPMPVEAPPGGLAVNVVNPLPIPVTGSVTTQAPSGGLDVNVVSPLPIPVTGSVSATSEREPMNFDFECVSDQLGCGQTLSVPEDMRLVIEYASFLASSLPPGVPAVLEITTSAGGEASEHRVPPIPLVPNGRSIGGQVVKLYGDPGHNVTVLVSRFGPLQGDGTTSVYRAAITGYFEPAPE